VKPINKRIFFILDCGRLFLYLISIETNKGHNTMSDKFILTVFIFLMSCLVALGLQSNAAQRDCEELNKNTPELLQLCPTLGN